MSSRYVKMTLTPVHINFVGNVDWRRRDGQLISQKTILCTKKDLVLPRERAKRFNSAMSKSDVVWGKSAPRLGRNLMGNFWSDDEDMPRHHLGAGRRKATPTVLFTVSEFAEVHSKYKNRRKRS